VLDRFFDERSFGYRPGRGPLGALAEAERLTFLEGRRKWLADDIRDAFGSVPIPRLLQVVRKMLPDDALIEFLVRVLEGHRGTGLRQGGSLSPLLLNAYLHHNLDRPWRRAWPDTPLLRYADDLLALAKTHREAEAAHAWLVERLLPAGFCLKGSSASVIHSLKPGPVFWLGFEIRGGKKRLRFGISNARWDNLAAGLDRAHEAGDAPLKARQVVQGWLEGIAPCFPNRGRRTVIDRISTIAVDRAFDELPAAHHLLGHWKAKFQRWNGRRSAVGEVIPKQGPD
jgi:Reverse transcriptase (RNA-dependent DNA polymerase)